MIGAEFPTRRAARLLAEAAGHWSNGRIDAALEAVENARGLLTADAEPNLRFECERALVLLHRAKAGSGLALEAARRLHGLVRAETRLAAFERHAASLLARCLLDAEHPTEAADVWPRESPGEPRDPQTLALWASTGIALGFGRETLAALTATDHGGFSPRERLNFALLEAAAKRSEGRLNEAILGYRQALNAAPPDDWRARAQCFEGLASVLATQGRYAEALALFSRAGSGLSAAPAAEAAPLLADVLLRQALLYAGPLRQTEQARRLAAAARQLGRPRTPSLAFLAGRVFPNLFSAAADETTSPAQAAERALIALIQSLRETESVDLPPEAADKLAAETIGELNQAVNPSLRAEAGLLLGRLFLNRDQSQAELFLTYAVEFARQAQLTDLLAEAQLHLGGLRFAQNRGQEALDLIHASSLLVQQARSQLTSATLRRSFGAGYFNIFEELAQLLASDHPRVAFELVERSLAHHAPIAAGPGNLAEAPTPPRGTALRNERPTDLGELRRLIFQLEPPSTSLEARYGDFDQTVRALPADGLFVTILSGRFKAVVLWLSGDGAAGSGVIDAGYDRLRRQALEWKRWVTMRRSAGNGPADGGPSSKEIRRMLFGPMQSVLQRNHLRRLVVLPGHDPLWQGFPFHALESDDGAPLAERLLVTYAPCLSAWLHCREQQRARARRRNVIGATFAVSEEDSPQVRPIRRQALAALSRHFRTRVCEASDERDAFAAWREATLAVHLGHCRPDPDLPANTHLALAPGHGLAAFELANLTAPRLKAFVLAACSGLHDQPGSIDEGAGPTASLLQAGAPLVLACGWPVEQGAAIAFVGRFFYHLRTKTIGDAYCAAQRDLRRSNPDIHHWASFFLTGCDGDPGPWPWFRRAVGRLLRRGGGKPSS